MASRKPTLPPCGDAPDDRYQHCVVAHLGAAYNLARWLTRDAATAEDAVQDACVRALRFLDHQTGPNPRAWFLAIVRNSCWDWVQSSNAAALHDPYEEDLHALPDADTPADVALRTSEARRVHRSIAALPVEFREVVVLRELEELSYREISAIIDAPIGTVMSRLSRARERLRELLLEPSTRRKA